MNELELFTAAVAFLDQSERTNFLDQECAGQPELRGRIERLIQAHERSHILLDQVDPGCSPAEMLQTVPCASEASGVVIDGKYTLIEVIGEGGMGAVWRARQSEPVKRFVAIKLIKPGMDSRQVLARFEAERQALAVMDHSNIAKVFDGGLHEQRPFFVMELVKGVPITNFCDARRLTLQERLELFLPVCDAIQHAHQKGIIHRDIKPSNVLVALYDDRPVVKVIDFGVAKATGGTLTERTIDTGFGSVVGTPQYMSPEQATFNNLDIDTRSDVYALGVLLYELLTGSPPFSPQDLERAGLFEMLRVVREVDPPRPSTRLSTANALPTLSANRRTEPGKLTGLLRNDLDWIAMKSLEKDRSRRYQTASGLAADVQRYLAGDVVQAHPPSLTYRFRKLIRKHKRGVIAASLVTTAVVLGLVGTLWQALRAEDARVEEARQRVLAEANERRAIAAAVQARQSAEQEASQRIRAEQAFSRTVDVLDAMVSGVTGHSLATQTIISEDQKKFLRNVLKYYQELLPEQGQDETARSRVARAAFRVGMIEERLGRKQEALAAFGQARELYASLSADFPKSPHYRVQLAWCHNNLADLEDDVGSLESSEHRYRDALRVWEQLVAEFPMTLEYRQDLALGYNNLGAVLRKRSRSAEAEECYRKSLSIRESLNGLPLFGNNPGYRRDLAKSHNHMGILMREQRKLDESEKHHRQALVLREKLVADDPKNADYRYELAATYNNLGNLLNELDRRVDAEESFRQAISRLEKLVAQYPQAVQYREDLAQGYHNIGLLLRRLNRSTEAELSLKNAVATQQKLAVDFPENPEYRSLLATRRVMLANTANSLEHFAEADEQYREALDLLEALRREHPDDAKHRLAQALASGSYGSSLRGRGEATMAIHWLSQAIEGVSSGRPTDASAKPSLKFHLVERAMAHNQLSNYSEAIRDWDRAIELCSSKERPGFRASRAISQLHLGLTDESVAIIKEVTRSDLASHQWYSCACFYALASSKISDRKDEFAEQAMVCLRKAVSAGWNNAVHMRKDHDLDALRERDDFKALIQQQSAATTKP